MMTTMPVPNRASKAGKSAGIRRIAKAVTGAREYAASDAGIAASAKMAADSVAAKAQGDKFVAGGGLDKINKRRAFTSK